MNIVFIVPNDYKEIGGLYLSINNQKSILEQSGSNVQVLEISYHPDNAEIDKIIMSLIELRTKGYDTIVPYTLRMSYSVMKKCKRNLQDYNYACFLIDSMRLNASSIIRNLRFGKQYLIELLRYIKYIHDEGFVLNSSERVGYVSPVDVDYVKHTYKTVKSRITCVPIGTNIYSTLPSIVENGRPLRIGVLAGASEKTNSDNLFPFLDEAFPKIVEDHPDITFVIAGNVKSDKDVSHIKSQKNVVYLGFVDKLSDFYNQVDIIITTVKKECGVLNRILEAWAFGKPVIGFEKNFKGFEYAKKNIDYLVADQWNDFCDLINGIASNEIDINSIARHANAMVQEYYTWEMSTRKLTEMIG